MSLHDFVRQSSSDASALLALKPRSECREGSSKRLISKPISGASGARMGIEPFGDLRREAVEISFAAIGAGVALLARVAAPRAGNAKRRQARSLRP
jgi:hypothetical protein